MIHQIDSKNEWLLLSVTFPLKFELVFVLTFENAFFRVFILKPTERAQILLQGDTRDFQNSPPFGRSACFFFVTISENLKHFLYINFNSNFLQSKNVFQKTGVPFFYLKPLRLKTHFHSKLLRQKPMLRKKEW